MFMLCNCWVLQKLVEHEASGLRRDPAYINAKKKTYAIAVLALFIYLFIVCMTLSKVETQLLNPGRLRYVT